MRDAYTLVFGGLLLLGARLGDILGRRRVLIAGRAVFALASLRCRSTQIAPGTAARRAGRCLG